MVSASWTECTLEETGLRVKMVTGESATLRWTRLCCFPGCSRLTDSLQKAEKGGAGTETGRMEKRA